MTLSIHGIAASRAIRPLWAAAELGLSFEHVPTPFAGGATHTPEFLAINPNGHIPVVVDAREAAKPWMLNDIETFRKRPTPSGNSGSGRISHAF